MRWHKTISSRQNSGNFDDKLDSQLRAALNVDQQLEAALKEAIEQSDRGEVRPHSEVWAEIRRLYLVKI